MPPIPVRPSPPSGEVPGSASTAHFGDIDEQAAALHGWNQRYLQLSRGRFQGSVKRLQLDGVGLFIEDLHQSVHQAGWVRKDVFAIGVPLLVEGEAQFCGHRATQQSLHVFSGDDGFEFHSPQRHVMIGIEMDRALFEANLGADLAEPGHAPQPGNAGVLQPDPAALGRLRNLITGLFQRMAHAEDPRRLELSSAQRHQARTDLLEQIAATWAPQDASAHASCDGRGASGCATAAQSALVERVAALVADHLSEAPSVGDICQAMGVSRRTLQSAFQAAWGMGPLAWLTTMRLNAVRRRLKSVDHVTDAATEFGFWHFGHFAGHYQALFGECPSQTLKRHRQTRGH
jgi:AraC family transcriptional regulator, ethanolamine operon transcriptional activator